MNIETEKLPIVVSEQLRTNPHIMGALAQRAFQLANYDMSPDNPVETAIKLGYIIVAADAAHPAAPQPAPRMTGNGSFA